VTRVLLTGAGGFLGSHVFEHVLAVTDWRVIATDSFRHKGRCDRLARILAEAPDPDSWRSRVSVITHDLAAPMTAGQVLHMCGGGPVDLVIAMASQSHVDRSLADPVPFVRNNVDVILNTLELCRQLTPQMVIVISTDEVYGPVTPGHAHPEWAPVLPSNPYAASKAAQEAIAVSYWRAYGLPAVIVNCMNLFGEMQDAEKFLPMMIGKISRGEPVPIHGRPGDIGSRHYLHARNLADALLFIYRQLGASAYETPTLAGFPVPRPDRYNIAGASAISNLDLACAVADVMGARLRYELVDFHHARPGHDAHYGLDPGKLKVLGWSPPVDFDVSLEKTVQWSLKHPEWLEATDG
jgi:dTDP-glucose 4,6-dehydratase